MWMIAAVSLNCRLQWQCRSDADIERLASYILQMATVQWKTLQITVTKQLDCIGLMVAVDSHAASAVWCPRQRRRQSRRWHTRHDSGRHNGGWTSHCWRRQLPLKQLLEFVRQAVALEALGLMYHSSYTDTAFIHGAIQTVKQAKQLGEICQTNAKYDATFRQVRHQMVATTEHSIHTSNSAALMH